MTHGHCGCDWAEWGAQRAIRLAGGGGVRDLQHKTGRHSNQRKFAGGVCTSSSVRHGERHQSEVSELQFAVGYGERRKMVAAMCNTVLVSILKPHGPVSTVARERTVFPRNLCSIPGRGKMFFCYRQLADGFSGYRGLLRQR